MAVDLGQLLADLRAESRELDDMIAGLGGGEWSRPTPAPGWTIGDQVTHLSYFDDVTMLSALDPGRFRAEAAELESHGPDFAQYVARSLHALSPAERLRWFRTSRRELMEVYAGLDAGTRLPWFGPSMSVVSSVTARLMETWAHGQDIADALDYARAPTVRLVHVAHLGVRTLGFAFQLHGLEVPTVPVRVELTAPDESVWAWGDPRADESVTGPALDFCLVVTQRRSVRDTSLEARGAVATQWLAIAQAFAGPPGSGREPRSVDADGDAHGVERT